jgi:hypothetical protein
VVDVILNLTRDSHAATHIGRAFGACLLSPVLEEAGKGAWRDMCRAMPPMAAMAYLHDANDSAYREWNAINVAELVSRSSHP